MGRALVEYRNKFLIYDEPYIGLVAYLVENWIIINNYGPQSMDALFECRIHYCREFTGIGVFELDIIDESLRRQNGSVYEALCEIRDNINENKVHLDIDKLNMINFGGNSFVFINDIDYSLIAKLLEQMITLVSPH